MPRGRKAKAATASHGQPTLSFNKKSARVTKTSTKQDDAAKKAASKLSESVGAEVEEEVKVTAPADVRVTPEPESTEIKVTIRESPSRPQTQRPQTKQKAVPAKDERELAAEKITDAQVKQYWKAEEDSRLAPRGMCPNLLRHQSDASCTGRHFAPLKARILTLSLTVHQSSLSLHEKILRHFDLSSQYGPCIGIQRLQRWKRANMLGLEPPVEVLAVLLREDKKTSQGCGKLAYIDELAGGRVVLVE